MNLSIFINLCLLLLLLLREDSRKVAIADLYKRLNEGYDAKENVYKRSTDFFIAYLHKYGTLTQGYMSGGGFPQRVWEFPWRTEMPYPVHSGSELHVQMSKSKDGPWLMRITCPDRSDEARQLMLLEINREKKKAESERAIAAGI